jgi:acetoacetate decarboxylase
VPTQVFADLAGGFATSLVLDHALSAGGRMKMSSTKSLLNMPKVNGIQPYPEPPYYSKNREYFVIDYETDVDLLRKVAPEPLEVKSNIAKYEFIRMPSYGLGDFTVSGHGRA